MKTIDKIIESKEAPKDKNVLWVNGDKLLAMVKGKWTPIGGGSSDNVQGGGESQYHEIKPNGWYWKSKEEVEWGTRLAGLEAHTVLGAIGESFKDTEYAPLNFAETYGIIGQLSRLSQEDDSFNTIYQRFPNYIQEAVPIKGALGLSNFNSVQEFFQFQGQDESKFLTIMEQMGWERITEEEYNEAKSKLG